MSAGLYLLSYVLLCVYFAVMIAAYKKARRQKSTLVQRIAPYRGGYFPRTPAVEAAGAPAAIVNGYRDLRRLCPLEAQELVTSLERAHLLAESLLALHERMHPFGIPEQDDPPVADVVPLHPGYSVKVS